MVEMAQSIDEDRAGSLRFRFDNEDKLVGSRLAAFSFGWGRFGRNRVYDEESGRDLSVTDGRWIITMGQFGFIGFLAEFGLLALPIFRAISALKFAETAEEQLFLAALALIVAINIVDLLPNSSLSPWTWLLAGALLGRAEALKYGHGRLSKTEVYPLAPQKLSGGLARHRRHSRATVHP